MYREFFPLVLPTWKCSPLSEVKKQTNKQQCSCTVTMQLSVFVLQNTVCRCRCAAGHKHTTDLDKSPVCQIKQTASVVASRAEYK